MTDRIDFFMNKSNASEICGHLSACGESFVHELNRRISIEDYSEKIHKQTVRFEAWAGEELIGLLAAYCNDRDQYIAYITNVSVTEAWKNMAIARRLMCQFLPYARKLGMRCIRLDVEKDNKRAIALYRQFGFTTAGRMDSYVKMQLIFD